MEHLNRFLKIIMVALGLDSGDSKNKQLTGTGYVNNLMSLFSRYFILLP